MDMSFNVLSSIKLRGLGFAGLTNLWESPRFTPSDTRKDYHVSSRDPFKNAHMNPTSSLFIPLSWNLDIT